MEQIAHQGLARRRFADSDPVYSLHEAAQVIGISVWTLKRRAKQDKIKILQMSARRQGVRESEIERYLKAAEI